jgi:hypothetical protein
MANDPTAGWAEVPAVSDWQEVPASAPAVAPQTPETDAFLSKSFASAFSVNADKRASILKLAEDSGAGADFIERNYDAMKSSWEASKFDPQEWRKQNPEVARTVLEHAQLAPIIMRDEKVSALTKVLRNISARLTMGQQEIYGRQVVQPLFGGEPITTGNPALAPTPADIAEAQQVLSGVPRQVPTVEDAKAKEMQALTGFSRARVPVAVFQDALRQAEVSRVGFSVLTGHLRGIDTWDEEKRLADLRAQTVPRDYGDAGFLEGIANDAASMGASEVSSIVAGGGGAALAGGAAFALTRNPGVAGEAAALGGKAGATTASFVHEAGSAYLDYRAARDDTGRPLPDSAAMGGALLYGALAAAVETASFGATEKTLGPVGEAVLSGKGKEYVKQLLLTNGGRELAARALKAWGERAGTEGIEEFVQQVLQDKIQKQIGDASITGAGTVERATSAFSQAAVGTLVLGGGEAVGVQAITKAMNAAGALRSTEIGKAITEAADSHTAKASPAVLADLIARETANSGEAVTHLYVDPNAALQAGAPVDPAAAKDALATGAKIEVPVAEYMEKWAPVVGDTLVDHMATRPGYMTAAEAKTAEPEVQAEAEAIAAEPVSDIPAVDEAVATQADRMGLQALPQDVLGVDAEAYAAYLDEQAKAKSTAARRAELAAAKDQLREKDAAWKEQEAAHREKAAAEFEALPARKTALWFRGKVVEEDGAVTPVQVPKMDHAATVAIVGKEAARKVPTVKTGGIHPDDMAGLVGYGSGKEMLEAVAALPEKNAWVKATADSRMRVENPALLEDRERLQRTVAQGLHGEESSRWLLKELQALRQKSGAGAVRAESIRRAATVITERQPVGTLNAHVVLQRERSAANKKAISAAKGEWGRAYVYAQQQLLNMHLWREIDAARDERDAFLELVANLRKPAALARLAKASTVYRDGAAGMLEALGLKQPETLDRLPATLDQVTQQIESDGASVVFDPGIIDPMLAHPRSWKELTVAEMREVAAYLKNVRAAARGRSTVLVEGKRLDLSDHATLLSDTAFANRKDRGPVSASPDTESTAEIGRMYGQAFDALNLRVETMAGWLDGDQAHGPWYRALVQPMQEGKVEENDMMEKLVKPIVDAFEAMPKEVKRQALQRVDGEALFPNHPSGEIKAPNRLVHLWMLWLYRGNEGGLERLASGRNITREEIDASIEKHGSKPVMDWLQTIWDAAESLKKPAFDLEEADSGVRPKSVEATAVETPWGKYRGGYWPNQYDHRPSQPTANQVVRSQGDLFDRTFTRPGTSHGHLKSRVETYNGVLTVATSTIYSHLNQVVHDIAFRQRVKSVGALLTHPEVDRALRHTLGNERAQQFLAWAKRIGTMRGDDSAMHLSKLNRLVGAMRGNVAVAMLGFRPRIGFGDLANLPVAMTHAGVSPRYLAGAMAELAGDTLSSAGGTVKGIAIKDWAFQNIGELRVMENQWRREYTQAVRKLTRRRVPIIAEVRDHAFLFMEMSFTGTAIPTAVAAYRQAQDAGASPHEAELLAGDVLRKVFPSHSPVDQSALLADKGFWGWSALFMGYLNTMYQRERDIVEPVLQSRGLAQFTGRLAYASGSMAALVVSFGVLAEFLMGRGKEEDEDWTTWLMRKGVTQALAPIPGLKDASDMAEMAYLGRDPSPRNANPLIMLGEAWVKAGFTTADEDKESSQKVAAVARALGLTFGIPQDPFTSQGPYLYDLATGQDPPDNPFDVASGLGYGHREGQPANPASVISDLIEGR